MKKINKLSLGKETISKLDQINGGYFHNEVKARITILMTSSIISITLPSITAGATAGRTTMMDC